MSCHTKYVPYVPLDMPNRQWPSRQTTSHPIWLSTDLRDGNQSLPDPMTIEQKIEFFRHLVKCGFKEIEVAFPAASETEFNFVRYLIENNEIPDDVWIQLLTPARPELIERTFESVVGAKQVIVHFYNATCPCFREVVFGKTKEEVKAMSVMAVSTVRRLSEQYRARYGTKFRTALALETFTQTEPEYVLEVASAVREAWGPMTDGPLIINLAATVEIGPPNHFADQIEYFSQNFKYRNEIILSVHTHNDRGTAIAASEMALLAGAERIEGTLFGNGERTGNVDLVTLALNMYTQGIDPGLDFSDLQASIDIVNRCTRLPIHPRHPYSGALVYTAFSGSHQDAIKKGFERQARRWAAADAVGARRVWEMPYLTLDPADVGRVWEVFVRINSQSGKGGSAFVVKRDLHVDMPRPVQQEFYQVVQAKSEQVQGEVESQEIVEAFCKHFWYGPQAEKARVVLGAGSACADAQDGQVSFSGSVTIAGAQVQLEGQGDNGLAAFLNAVEAALGLSWDVHQHEDRDGQDVTTAFVLLSPKDRERAAGTWGVGADRDPALAAVRAAVSAINKLIDGSGSIDTEMLARAAVLTAYNREILRGAGDAQVARFMHSEGEHALGSSSIAILPVGAVH